MEHPLEYKISYEIEIAKLLKTYYVSIPSENYNYKIIKKLASFLRELGYLVYTSDKVFNITLKEHKNFKQRSLNSQYTKDNFIMNNE